MDCWEARRVSPHGPPHRAPRRERCCDWRRSRGVGWSLRGQFRAALHTHANELCIIPLPRRAEAGAARQLDGVKRRAGSEDRCPVRPRVGIRRRALGLGRWVGEREDDRAGLRLRHGRADVLGEGAGLRRDADDGGRAQLEDGFDEGARAGILVRVGKLQGAVRVRVGRGVTLARTSWQGLYLVLGEHLGRAARAAGSPLRDEALAVDKPDLKRGKRRRRGA